MTGWICVHRKIQENAIWKDKPFSKGQAWIDLLLLASYEDKKIPVGNEFITVKRGEVITSLRRLASKWGWSRCKVKAFLDLLVEDEMVDYFIDSNFTKIAIKNYELYQDIDTRNQEKNWEGDRPQTDHHVTLCKADETEVISDSEKESLSKNRPRTDHQVLKNRPPSAEKPTTNRPQTDHHVTLCKADETEVISDSEKESLSENRPRTDHQVLKNRPPSAEKPTTTNNIYNNNNNHRVVLCRTFLDRIKNDWNDLPDPIAKITNISSGTKRYDFLKARLNDYGEDEILRAIKNIHESDFLQGKNNMGWRITFDWFIKPNNFIKVLENNYKNNTNTNTNTNTGTGNKTYNKKPSYNWQHAQSNRLSTEDIENKLKQKQMEMIKNVLNGSDNHGV